MRKQIRFLLTVMAGCLIATSGWAASIGGNFIGRGAGSTTLLPTETAGVVPQAFWNNVSSDPFDGVTTPLLDSAGSFTAVKLIYDTSDSWNSDGPTATPDDRLMKGIIKANPDPDTVPINNSERMLFVFTNLPAGATFDVIVYSMENGNFAEMNVAVGATTYYIAQQASFNGTYLQATSTTPGGYTDANYARFNGVPVSGNGTITITCLKNVVDPQVNDGIGVPAVQLVQVSGSPPAANTELCSITANPQTTFAVVGGTATFTVGTQGPCRIQWTKNGSPLVGEVNPTLVLTPVLADDSAQIRAIVWNNVNTNTSPAATLFVDPVTAPVLKQGFLTAERWTGMTGTSVQPIKDAIANLTPPNSTFYAAGPNLAQTAPDLNDFGVRLSGWLKPDVTGYYDFFTRSDDASAVYLNAVNPGTGTNALPDVNSAAAICEETGCCEGFKEPNPGLGQPFETTSEPIFLEAGKLYGFVVLLKEGGGGDFLQVAWRRTNDTVSLPAGSLKPIPPGNCLTFASGAGQRASITTQPASISVVEGRPASFNIGVQTLPTAGLYGVQWRANGSPVIGESGNTYTIAATTLADNNKQIDAFVYTLPGVLTSAPPAVLTVIPDTFPPVPAAGAISSVSGQIQVGVGFDEPVNQADLVPGNFTVLGATTATARFPTNSFGDYKGVVIDTTGLVVGNTYTARVSNVRDLKGNAIPSTGVNASFKVPANVAWAESGVPKRPGQVIPVGADGFDILNGGRKEWEAYDEVTMAYVKKTNDFDVKVRVMYAEPGSQWTRVGLMARNELDVGEGDGTGGVNPDASAYAQTHVNPSQTIWSANRIDPTGLTPANTGANNGHEQNQRLAKAANTSGWGSTGTQPQYPNAWLRLQRQGSTLRGFRSTDGVNWVDQGTTTLTDQQPDMFVGPFLAIETANIWNSLDHGVFTSPFDPKFDRLFLAQFRDYGDVVTVQPTPTLSLSVSGGNVIITYTGVLQSATVVTGPYTDVGGATSPYSTAPSGPAKFFRSRSP